MLNTSNLHRAAPTLESGCEAEELQFSDLAPGHYERLCFVMSGLPYPIPGFGVGGSGSPLTTVTSVPWLPPRGPSTGYCPLTGALWPGLKDGVFAIACFTSFQALRRQAPSQGSRARFSMPTQGTKVNKSHNDHKAAIVACATDPGGGGNAHD